MAMTFRHHRHKARKKKEKKQFIFVYNQLLPTLERAKKSPTKRNLLLFNLVRFLWFLCMSISVPIPDFPPGSFPPVPSLLIRMCLNFLSLSSLRCVRSVRSSCVWGSIVRLVSGNVWDRLVSVDVVDFFTLLCVHTQSYISFCPRD